jgi:arsenite methyltransferase
VLDVGCGDGLIAFGALDRGAGTVVFSDISSDLLDECRRLVAELGVAERCRFVEAPAEALTPIEDESVDVVTTRSVLIYVADKSSALREFRRVLRPGGRISLYEPINRFGAEERRRRGRYFGYDARRRASSRSTSSFRPRLRLQSRAASRRFSTSRVIRRSLRSRRRWTLP